MIYDYKNAVDACKYIGTPGLFLLDDYLGDIYDFVYAKLQAITCEKGVVNFLYKNYKNKTRDIKFDCASMFIPLSDIPMHVLNDIEAGSGKVYIHVYPFELPKNREL